MDNATVKKGFAWLIGYMKDALSGKADKTEIPSLSGYATETYVQTQISAIPDELPTVTASDNGKFLRVVSGAWAAATVPAAENASFGGGS